MWLYDNWDRRRASAMKMVLTIMNIFLVVLGLYLMISGVSPILASQNSRADVSQTWGAAKDIKDSYDQDGGSSPWSCADNSNSV